MQRKFLNWKMTAPVLAVLLMLATATDTGRADLPPAKTDVPQPLPQNIVTIWNAAGAEACWLRAGLAGSLSYVPENEGKPGDLPAFRFAVWHEGRLAKLPGPVPVFGLDLYRTQVTDAGLKELAALESLQVLDLGYTQVTGAGLKELAGLQNLQALNLIGTQVTGAGLKELAGLKSLQTLNLCSTPVTDGD